MKQQPIFVPHLGWMHYPQDDEVARFLGEGWFEYQEQAFFWLYLREGDVVIDGGAHAGLYASLAGKLVGGSGQVIAVEPNPDIQEILRANLQTHCPATSALVAAALEAEPGTVDLHTGDETRSAYDSTHIAVSGGRVVRVDATSLDQLLRERQLSAVALLKLDVEGGELEALTGGRIAFQEGRVDVAMVEFTEMNLRGRERTSADLAVALADLGLVLCRFNPEAVGLEPVEVKDPIWYENLFAVRDPDAVTGRLRSASEGRRRVAQEVLRRGQLSKALLERAEAQRSPLEKTPQDYARLEGLVSETVEMLARARVEARLADQRHRDTLLEAAGGPLKLLRRRSSPHDMVVLDEAQARLRPVEQFLRKHAERIRATPGSAVEPRLPVSVILCTYNPSAEKLAAALASIASQSLEPGAFELVVVDNNSNPPVADSHPMEGFRFQLRVVREQRQGLIYARVAGIRAASGRLLVFVDDDNVLAPDYLERACEIAAAHPHIGTFGGVSEAVLNDGCADWKRPLLPFLAVRDYGPQEITSFEHRWGKWEPIGAGMVSRRDVGEDFADFVESAPDSGSLGRKGVQLFSCEDTLFARIANRAGYACSYQPKLRLKHYIEGRRLRSRYLFELLVGLGRSYVRLERILGNDMAPITGRKANYWLLKRLLAHVVWKGRRGFVEWGWDIGYVRESAARAPAEANATNVG